MATRTQLNISTYYESFLVLSLNLRIGNCKRQLKMETSRGNQLPVLRYRDVSFTSEYLKDSLSAVCPLMGVHNVARVRQGALPLFEVDFTEEKALDKFCLSISNGMLCIRNLAWRLLYSIMLAAKLRLNLLIFVTLEETSSTLIYHPIDTINL